MPIQRLSVQLANQIAAGEVVERPASVVKELMENAIDAKATSITLEIAKSGKNLIKVTDNGSGIPKDELVLALAPHATSKISKLEDLDAIYTLGFRGEALASIASVSKLTLISRTQEQDHAFQVEVSGPEQNTDVQPAAHPVGTSVVVRELFFNTPARRRFLKADKTEFNHIKELFIRLALVNFGVEFKFISDGKVILHVQPIKKADISQRIGKLLGLEFKREGMYFDSSLRGKSKRPWSSVAEPESQGVQDADHNADVDDVPTFDLEAGYEPVIKLFGVILPPPSLTQSLPDRLLTFLNGRMIADKTVNHAIKEGYIDSILMPHDKFKPSVRAVIFMECDPHIVDVNVHPRKDEVRFHNGSLIHETIKQEIVAVLDAYGLNQRNANQSVLDPSLMLDKEKLESKIEPKATAIEQAQQRLLNWQQQEERAKWSREYEERSYKNDALQTYIDAYFKYTAQPLRPVVQGPCVLKGRLCDLRHIRSPMAELEARKSAQREYDAYHQRIYGSAARVSPQAQSFMEHVQPILKSDIKAQAELAERQARERAKQELREAVDEYGNLKQAFDLDDLSPSQVPSQANEAPNPPYQGWSEGQGTPFTPVSPPPMEAASQGSWAQNGGANTFSTQAYQAQSPQGDNQPQPDQGEGRGPMFDPRWRQSEQECLRASLQGQVQSSPDFRYSPQPVQGNLAPYPQGQQTAGASLFENFSEQDSTLLQPQREHAPGLFEQLDKNSFMGTGNANLASTNAGQAIQQRYNQHMLGLHNLQSAPQVSAQEASHPAGDRHVQAQGHAQATSQLQSSATEQSSVVSLSGHGARVETFTRQCRVKQSEFVAPAGTGSAFNSVRSLGLGEGKPQTVGNQVQTSLNLHEAEPSAVLCWENPGTDTLDPMAKTNGENKLSSNLHHADHLELDSARQIYMGENKALVIRTSQEEEKAELLEETVSWDNYVEYSSSSSGSLADGAPNQELQDNLDLAAGGRSSGNGGNGGDERKSSYFDHEIQSKFLSLVAHDVILFMLENRYYVGRGSELYYSFATRNYLRQVIRNEVESFELQMRFGVRCSGDLLRSLKQDLAMQAARRCGFKVEANVGRGILEIAKVPMLLTSTDLARVVPRVLSLIVQDAAQIVMGKCGVEIGQEIARVRKFEVASAADAKLLLSRIDSFELLQNVKHSSDIKELKLHNLALSMLRNNS